MELPLSCSLPVSTTLGYLHSTLAGGDGGIFLCSNEIIHATLRRGATTYVTLAKSAPTHMTFGTAGATSTCEQEGRL
jgi:hypothetical protein